jgi:predicted DNA-binding transcriptional regulator AlpA
MYEDRIRARLELAKQKEYLDINDVMLLSGYSPSTIRRRIDDGVLEAFQNVPKGKLLFKKENVIKWLEKGGI